MTELDSLPTTESGAVRKSDAMRWLETLSQPSKQELVNTVTAKPKTHTGSTHPTPISNIRVTGDADFVETFAGLLKPFLDLESDDTRLDLKVERIEDRETGELTNNFALYISAVERG